MKVILGDLKLTDGTTIREIGDECDNQWVCVKCPYYGDLCDGNIRELEVELPQIVRRGRWKYDENAVDYNMGGWCCSECGTRNNNLPNNRLNPYQFSGSRYCPQCGAKMDGTEAAK